MSKKLSEILATMQKTSPVELGRLHEYFLSQKGIMEDDVHRYSVEHVIHNDEESKSKALSILGAKTQVVRILKSFPEEYRSKEKDAET